MLRRIHAVSAAIALAALGLAASGCDEPEPAPPPGAGAKPASAAPAATASAVPAAPPAPPSAAAGAGRMANCPSAVEGAATDITDVDGGVELSITAEAEPAAADIRARARVLAEAAGTESTTRRHTGTGEGGGAFGRCPVILRETAVTVADVEGGARITVKANKPGEVDWLRRESRERLAALAQAGK